MPPRRAGSFRPCPAGRKRLLRVRHSPDARPHLTLLSDVGKLKEWLRCELSWTHEERAAGALEGLDRLITRCTEKQCAGKHPNEIRRKRDEAKHLKQVRRGVSPPWEQGTGSCDDAGVFAFGCPPPFI